MVKIRGPIEFAMGADRNDSEREPYFETRHSVVIPRSFAISATEVIRSPEGIMALPTEPIWRCAAFLYQPADARASHRSRFSRIDRTEVSVGFRIARTLPEDRRALGK